MSVSCECRLALVCASSVVVQWIDFKFCLLRARPQLFPSRVQSHRNDDNRTPVYANADHWHCRYKQASSMPTVENNLQRFRHTFRGALENFAVLFIPTGFTDVVFVACFLVSHQTLFWPATRHHQTGTANTHASLRKTVRVTMLTQPCWRHHLYFRCWACLQQTLNHEAQYQEYRHESETKQHSWFPTSHCVLHHYIISILMWFTQH